MAKIRFQTSEYTNRKGEERVSVLMSRADAKLLALATSSAKGATDALTEFKAAMGGVK